MELGLSLGEVALAKTFSPARKRGLGGGAEHRRGVSRGLERETAAEEEPTAAENDTAADSPVQLDLLPSSPLPRSPSSHSLVHPWPKPASDSSASQTGKKLCFSKEQSALLEESFREHKFLNYKQKIALAKQLNVRLRQVEVWFQNRRTRAKLKQTEVDCEYFKSCCDRLTEENRRLHKELQELRALKTSHPLTVSPSCERVATAATASSSAGAPPVRRRLSAL